MARRGWPGGDGERVRESWSWASLSEREYRSPAANCYFRVRFYHGRVTELRRNLARSMKRRRAALAISQAQLAERAGISTGYVGELEMGTKDPSLETLSRIAAALAVQPYRLMMSDEDVADAAGRDALYEAVDLIRQRLDEQMDDLRRGETGRPRDEKGT